MNLLSLKCVEASLDFRFIPPDSGSCSMSGLAGLKCMIIIKLLYINAHDTPSCKSRKLARWQKPVSKRSVKWFRCPVLPYQMMNGETFQTFI